MTFLFPKCWVASYQLSVEFFSIFAESYQGHHLFYLVLSSASAFLVTLIAKVHHGVLKVSKAENEYKMFWNRNVSAEWRGWSRYQYVWVVIHTINRTYGDDDGKWLEDWGCSVVTNLNKCLFLEERVENV